MSARLAFNYWARMAHAQVVARRFRFRVREGHQIHSYGGEGTATHEPGYEFVLSEKDAAGLFRDSGSRRAYELVEVLDDSEAMPPGELPVRD
jgi:hypothetical protein